MLLKRVFLKKYKGREYYEGNFHLNEYGDG